jgi:hypothetical protein
MRASRLIDPSTLFGRSTLLDGFIASARPEIRTLLLCARACIDPNPGLMACSAESEVFDWKFLYGFALHHGLLPVVCQYIDRVTAVPKSARLDMHSYWQLHCHRNLLLSGELTRIIGLCRENGIGAVPFKGPVLAALAYCDLRLREFGDLDILVPEAELIKAAGLLKSVGYELGEGEWSSAGDRFSSEDATTFINPTSKIVVELHPRLIGSRFARKLGRDVTIWDRLIEVNLAGIKTPSLSREDTILYLAVHEAKHRWVRLEGILCIAALTRPEVDWMFIMRSAVELGIDRQVLVILLLACSLFEVELPGFVLERANADSSAIRLTNEIGSQLMQPPVPGFRAGITFSRDLRVRNSWSDRIRFIGFGPNERDRRFSPFPPSLSFLLYTLRPLRLVRDYGRDLSTTLLKRRGRNT